MRPPEDLHLEMVEPTPEDLAVNAARFRITAGAPRPSGPTPTTPHPAPESDTGAPPDTPPTRGETTRGPEMHHSGEQPTPQMRADAWAALMGSLQGRLVSTRLNAEGHARRVAAIRDDTGHTGRAGHQEADWLATAWAARKLLDQLMHIPAPEVPRDDTLGQATLEDALEDQRGSDAATGIRTMLARIEALSTTVEETVEDPRVVTRQTCYWREPHPVEPDSRGGCGWRTLHAFIPEASDE